MKKPFYVFLRIVICTCIIIGGILYIFGFYPIVSVDGTLISQRAWQRTLNAEKQVVNVHAHATHIPLIDFVSPKNARLLDTIRQTTLTFLIDSVIIQNQGSVVVPDLDQLSLQRVNDELRKTPITESTAATVYGLDVAALKQTVLIPQARQEILSETLALEQKDFSGWLLNARAHTRVKFFFGSFQWDQDGVK